MHSYQIIEAKSLKELFASAQDFVEKETDRYLIPNPKYSKNQMAIHYDVVFSNRKDAEKWIFKHETRRNPDHAVRYYAETAEMKKIKKEIQKRKEEREKYIADNSIKKRASAYIGCQNCGSKLNKEMLKGEKCPVCGSDLRSKTTLNRIDSYDKRIKNLEKKYKEAEKKQRNLVWIAKVETIS